MKSRSVREEAVRLVLLLAGLCVAHLGVTLFLQTDLGSDPFNVFVQGLFRFLPWPGFMTHGRVHLLVSLVIMVVLLVVDRKFVRIGTVVCMALGGPIIDVFTVLLAPLIHSERPLPVRLAALVLGCVILAFGMTIVICSEAGTGPNDLFFALSGFALGGVLGLGTVICAFVVGPAAQRFMPVSRRICDGFVHQFAGRDSLPRGDSL